jgi:hypothetical protein
MKSATRHRDAACAKRASGAKRARRDAARAGFSTSGKQKRATNAAITMPTIDIRPNCISPAKPDSIIATKPALDVSTARPQAFPQIGVVRFLPLHLNVDRVIDRFANQRQPKPR